jgi:hypothetical protein
MTKQVKTHQAGNRRHWEAHLKAAAKSGLSRAEYCRRYNLSYHTMGYWHKRVSRESIRQKIVPVKMALVQTEDRRDEAGLKILLPGKMSVVVGDNFSPGTLDRLLTTLENR